MGKLLCEKNLRDVWCRNESVRAEIGPILQTHTHTRVSYSSIDSVLTCRQHIINSSASAPPNATKIAMKKVSDVDVCMFGPEL